MNLSLNGINFIKGFEEFRSVSYQDERGIWTCGYGHTRGVTATTVCTASLAQVWLLEDCVIAVNTVNQNISVPLSQNQFDALVSFTFNDGATAEAHSTLRALLDAGNYAAAAEEFPKWDHVDGVVSAGLQRRRLAEQAMFLS
jgi:lysozyme